MPIEDAPPPSAWVVRFAPLVAPDATVLDVACGGGRHSRFMLERGHRVTSVDRDLSGVADLAGVDRFGAVATDLEAWPWPFAARRFAGIIVTNYLWRPILPSIVAAVGEGGVLIYETFAAGNERFGRPSRPAFLLHAGELLEAVRGQLQVVAYEHGIIEAPRPAVVQRLCAMRRDEPASL